MPDSKTKGKIPNLHGTLSFKESPSIIQRIKRNYFSNILMPIPWLVFLVNYQYQKIIVLKFLMTRYVPRTTGVYLRSANCPTASIHFLLKGEVKNFESIVFQTTVLLADINDFVAMNNIYKTFFTQREPARAAYQVRKLAHLISWIQWLPFTTWGDKTLLRILA